MNSLLVGDIGTWYNSRMAAKLTKELVTALHAAGDDGLEVVDPETNRLYLIVNEETHRQAMLALKALRDREAIAEGIAQMEAGQGQPAEQVFEDLRTRLGFPQEA
ncbi:MAG: hypothetical protein Tsb009_30770 [Planctomycetaceae bacterium]